MTDEIRFTSGPNPQPYVVVTQERLRLVAAHLKERFSVSPYYKARGEKNQNFWMMLARGMPLLPLPEKKTLLSK